MRPIGRAIERTLRALGMDREVARADAVRAWPASAGAVFGDARETRALRADGDTLVVAVPSAHWAGEIRLRERELVRALRERAPTSGIARVRAVPSATLRR